MGIFEPIANLGPAWVFVINLACVIVAGFLITAGIVKALRKVLKRSEKIDDAIVIFVVNAVKVICIVILVTIILQMFGVSMTTIVAVLGAAGAAIALALKDSLANVAGGIMIIITHPFGAGDLISVGETRGYVEAIDLFLTKLRTFDRRTVTIPNGIINTSVVYNESNRQIRRVDRYYSIAYEADLSRAIEVLHKVCEESEYIVAEPAPIIGAGKYEDSGITVECLAYCNVEDYWNAGYDLGKRVKEAFAEAGIEIPYPHMDVTMRDDERRTDLKDPDNGGLNE